MWDKDAARRKLEEQSGLSQEELRMAEKAARKASTGSHGAQIRELFESRENMTAAMQAMDLTNEHFQAAFLALQGMDDDATTEAVSLGLMMNLVMILRVIQRDPVQILDLCSRAVELSSLFEDAVMDTSGRNPFTMFRNKP